MLDSDFFYQEIRNHGTELFTGVPDSLLKSFCSYLSDNTTQKCHITAANEGGAIAIAIGHYLATSKVPFVYMQNSGLGNSINPLLSLADEEVYSIPMILMVGWRGKPGVKDEPQHIKQGKVTELLLKSMGVQFAILNTNTTNDEASKIISEAYKISIEFNVPYVLLVEKNTFSNYTSQVGYEYKQNLTREQALKKIIETLTGTELIISTTGMLSRELNELKKGAGDDFLTVGGMGHANQIALGVALSQKERNVICLDGDGALLMHMGSLAVNTHYLLPNYKHILINNGVHDSVGGQVTSNPELSYSKLASSMGYGEVFTAISGTDIQNTLRRVLVSNKCSFVEILVNKGNRADLSRPKSTPLENKFNFMKKCGALT